MWNYILKREFLLNFIKYI
uniref:Uncharacterized protein n=1 Tax=Anguilla anguilla TaxID=7936 RepID=A0A0E9V987_ANGAN